MSENKTTAFPDDYNLNELLKVNFSGFFMYVTKRYKHHYIDNEYEKFSSDLFINYVEERSVVVDVGANYGYYALLASTKNKKGKTYAIEPVKENFDILNKNVQENVFSQIETLNLAISNKTGEREFNVTEASDSAGFYEHPNTKILEKRIIKTKSIDELFNNKKIDIIKIDAEGHEEYILKGMRKIIQNNPAIKLLVEFNPKCLKKAKSKPESFLKLIQEYGFDIFFINDQGRQLSRLIEPNQWKKYLKNKNDCCNILCINSKKAYFGAFLVHSGTKSGAERSLLELIQGLVKRDFLCHIMAPEDGPLIDEFRKLPVSIDFTPLPRWAKYIEQGPEFSIDEIEKIKESIQILCRKLKETCPNLVHTTTSVICQGAFAAKFLNLPHVWHMNEFGELDHGLKFLLPIKKRAKFAYKYSDKIIFNSKALARYYENFIPNDKSEVIYYNVKIPKNAYNIENLKKDTLKLLLIGQIQEGKGQMDAIKAIKKLREKGIFDINLKIVGPGSSQKYQQEILEFINANSLNSQIEISEYIEDPSGYFKEADIILMCSKAEAFGRVTVEGMLYGKPVIGARAGGTMEIIKNEENGLLYEAGNINDLSDKILYFYQNRDKIRIFGTKGKNFAENNFTEENYVGKKAKIFKALALTKNKINFWNKLFSIFAKKEKEVKSMKFSEF